ncbi:MAG: YfhO family protein, partial [Chloroflexota bacterium]|nr:YfhO family protein [Chloroflexota bacterium]
MAILGMGLLAAVFLGGALTGRVLSPAAWLYSQAPWSATMPPADLGPGNGLLSDSVLQFEPWLAYAAQRLHAGALPLWNPNNMLGAPFIGNMQSAVFDPLNWPYLLWPDPLMPALRAWLKLMVAALGTYGLARAILRVGPVPAALAAISFAFSTFLTVWLLYPLSSAVVWLPWLWWATARLIAQPHPRSVAALAVLAALPLLAGQPEMALHLVLASGAWALFCAIRAGGGWRGLTRIALWAGGYALGTLLAAIQVLPFLEYLSQSAAWQARAGAQPDLWLPPYLAWTLVSPLLFGTPIHSDWWDMWTNYNEAANYAGLLPLLLLPWALRGRAQRGLALFLIGGALLAAGVAYHLPVVFDAWTRLPLLQTAANQRLIVLVQFALALLGAVGLQAVAAGWETEETERPETGRLKSRLQLRSPPARAEIEETEEVGRNGARLGLRSLPARTVVEKAEELGQNGARLGLRSLPVRAVGGMLIWLGVLLVLGVGVPSIAESFFHLPAVGEARIKWAAGLG